jgi:impB/mucB/samB family
VSCERVFQPELRGKPILVLSNNGCVIARSNEAKALGIAMSAPQHLHRKQFETAGVIVRSSNYTLYGDMSSRVMSVLSTFTPDLEIYSIDEALLGLGGFGSRLESHARTLRATVCQWTGIPVSTAYSWRNPGASPRSAAQSGVPYPLAKYRECPLAFPRFAHRALPSGSGLHSFGTVGRPAACPDPRRHRVGQRRK